MTVIEFEVLGIPMPQGSMKAFSANGQARMKPSGGTGFAAWRNAVAVAAKDIAEDHGKLDGPLDLELIFRFPMPKSRSKAVRAFGLADKTTAPDLDKLVRSIGDSLTAGGLIADDARICHLTACKVETTGWTGATIRLWMRGNP